MSYEESYAKAFPFDKMVSGMLNLEMIEDTAKIVNEAVNDRYRVNLIINNRAGSNAPLIAQKIAERLHSEKEQLLAKVRNLPFDRLRVNGLRFKLFSFSVRGELVEPQKNTFARASEERLF